MHQSLPSLRDFDGYLENTGPTAYQPGILHIGHLCQLKDPPRHRPLWIEPKATVFVLALHHGWPNAQSRTHHYGNILQKSFSILQPHGRIYDLQNDYYHKM